MLRSRFCPFHTQTPPCLLTVDESLLLWRDDADQVGVGVPAVLLCFQPRLSVEGMLVAVPLKLSPTDLTQLLVCHRSTRESTSEKGPFAQLSYLNLCDTNTYNDT